MLRLLIVKRKISSLTFKCLTSSKREKLRRIKESAVVVFLVGALALEDHVARDTVLDDEAELRLVDYILLGAEVHHQLLRQELAFIIIHWHWGHAETGRHHS